MSRATNDRVTAVDKLIKAVVALGSSAICLSSVVSLRRLRQLIERYHPEILPEALRPVPAAPPAAPLLHNNIVHFPENEN